MEGEGGRQYAQYGIGQPLLAVPFYALGKAAAPAASLGTWMKLYGIETTGNEIEDAAAARTIATRFACSFFNIFASALLAALVFLLCFEFTEHKGASYLAAALYAFGSLAWAHSRPFFTETAAVLFIVLAWFALMRATRRRMTLWCIVAGAAAGYAALVRLDSVLLYPGLALVLLGPIRKAAPLVRPAIHPFIAFCLPAAACGAAILGLNAMHFGGPLATGYTDQPEGVKFSTPLLAGLYGFLFSAGKGMFFFSPGLIVGLLGWKAARDKNAWLAWGLGLSVLVPLLIQSKWQNWAGGWCWGPRHIFMIHPFLAIPASMWLAHAWNPVRRSVAFVLLVVGIGVQLLGCSQSFITFHDYFFRQYGPQTARVLYDGHDPAYWSTYFRVNIRHPEREEWAPGGLAHVPAPIQHSLYIPQHTVWRGYPQMWRDLGTIDNLWVTLLRDQSSP